MTPKMKEDLCVQIHSAGRQLFLSGRITEVCREKGTQNQLEFLLEIMNEELALREENRRKPSKPGRWSVCCGMCAALTS